MPNIKAIIIPTCLVLLCGQAFGASNVSTKVEAKQNVGAKADPAAAISAKELASKNLAAAVWTRILEKNNYSLTKKRALAEQIHDAITRAQFTKADEGLMTLALAVLHSYDSNTKYSALPLVVTAKQIWPEIINHRNLPQIWGIFENNFADSDTRNEITLAGIAANFEGHIFINSNTGRFNYFRGLNFFKQNNYADALTNFAKIPIDSSDYRLAKYLEAVSLVNLDRLFDARAALQMVVALDKTEAEANSPKADNSGRLRELGVLTIARILYEQGKFVESLAYYRTLMQDSLYFYESIYEQSWAFFMAGYPNRAMGAAYSATSPFFKDRFNADVRFLDAVVSYWLCDFKATKLKLQIFINDSVSEGDLLRGLVGRVGSLAPADATLKFARLVEDYSRGGSASNIGLGPITLATLFKNEKIVDALKILNKSIDTRLKLQNQMIYSAGKAKITSALSEFEGTLRINLGNMVRAQIVTMKGEFEKALNQSRLLYLEVLTAEKDLLMGRDRSVNNFQFNGSEKEFFDLNATTSRTWRQDKNEYWYDELGFYVFQQKSQCKGNFAPKVQGFNDKKN